jgi:hypothetical protein
MNSNGKNQVPPPPPPPAPGAITIPADKQVQELVAKLSSEFDQLPKENLQDKSSTQYQSIKAFEKKVKKSKQKYSDLEGESREKLKEIEEQIDQVNKEQQQAEQSIQPKINKIKQRIQAAKTKLDNHQTQDESGTKQSITNNHKKIAQLQREIENLKQQYQVANQENFAQQKELKDELPKIKRNPAAFAPLLKKINDLFPKNNVIAQENNTFDPAWVLDQNFLEPAQEDKILEAFDSYDLDDVIKILSRGPFGTALATPELLADLATGAKTHNEEELNIPQFEKNLLSHKDKEADATAFLVKLSAQNKDFKTYYDKAQSSAKAKKSKPNHIKTQNPEQDNSTETQPPSNSQLNFSAKIPKKKNSIPTDSATDILDQPTNSVNSASPKDLNSYQKHKQKEQQEQAIRDKNNILLNVQKAALKRLEEKTEKQRLEPINQLEEQLAQKNLPQNKHTPSSNGQQPGASSQLSSSMETPEIQRLLEELCDVLDANIPDKEKLFKESFPSPAQILTLTIDKLKTKQVAAVLPETPVDILRSQPNETGFLRALELHRTQQGEDLSLIGGLRLLKDSVRGKQKRPLETMWRKMKN